MIQKVYEVNPMECPYCGCEMKVVAVIMDKEEIAKIIIHLEKIKNKAPPETVSISAT